MRKTTSLFSVLSLCSVFFLSSCGTKAKDSLDMDALIQHFSRRGLHPVETSASGDHAMALLAAMRGAPTNAGTKVQLSASKTLLLDGNKVRVRAYENPAAAKAAFQSLQAFQEQQLTSAEDQGRSFFPSHFYRKGPYLFEVMGSKLGADLKPRAVQFAEGFLDKVEQAVESLNRP